MGMPPGRGRIKNPDTATIAANTAVNTKRFRDVFDNNFMLTSLIRRLTEFGVFVKRAGLKFFSFFCYELFGIFDHEEDTNFLPRTPRTFTSIFFFNLRNPR